MGPLWAIARNTILMTVRRRAPLVLVLFVVIAAPALSFFAEGDSTIAGRMKIILTYNFTIISALLMVLMLLLSATSLDSEIRGKQMLLLDVKPITRWKLLLGKWLGMILLSGWLLLIMGVMTYAAVMFNARMVRGAPEQLLEANRQVLVSRRSFRPEMPDVEREIALFEAQLKQEGKLDASKWDGKKIREQAREYVRMNLWPIPYGAGRGFSFKNLPPPGQRNAAFTVRYKVHGSRGSEGGGWLNLGWQLTHPDSGVVYSEETTLKSGNSKEFEMDAQAIGADGSLEVILFNLSGPEGDKPPAMLNVPLSDGLEVLVPSGSFEGNFARALFLLWIRLAMIAGIGIAVSTFLSGPIAAFFVLGLLAVGLCNSFVSGVAESGARKFLRTQTELSPEAQKKEAEKTGWDKTTEFVSQGFDAGLLNFLRVMPDFDKTDPVADLVVGREITYGRLLWRMFIELGLHLGIVAALGVNAFYRREVGLPTG
jgi:ABC-type transport system involved in multi-copper enzyme maturation permease subunit